MVQKNIWIHKKNRDEWRFVGIWEDFLNYKNLTTIYPDDYNENYLFLFKKYDSPLEVVQENLRLRNLYNLYITANNKEKLAEIDKEIVSQIEALLNKSELCIYDSDTDSITNIKFLFKK